jgi:hypothetical protein
MVHLYDIDICIAHTDGKLPSYGCAIRLKHLQSQIGCVITSGLGSGDCVYKSYKLAISALRHKDAHKTIRCNVSKPDDVRLNPVAICWDADCISLLEMAKEASLNQEYKYDTRSEP